VPRWVQTKREDEQGGGYGLLHVRARPAGLEVACQGGRRAGVRALPAGPARHAAAQAALQCRSPRCVAPHLGTMLRRCEPNREDAV